jgi:nucleoside diphosphate kinase
MSKHALHPAIGSLTRNPLKGELYSQEPYFREAFLDLEVLLGEVAIETVLRHGLVVVKPDGYSLGATSTVLDYYVRHGFQPIGVRLIEFAPTVWRTLWTYQMSQASIDRLLVNDLVISGDAVALIFQGRTGAGLPATVELSALKGPARMENQDDDCLRRAIGQPNRIFSLVHSADEPADLVRELGILFCVRDRRQLAGAMASEELSTDNRRLLDEIRRSDVQPRRSFDRDASRKRVIDAVIRRLHHDRSMPPSHHEILRRGVDELDANHPFQMSLFLGALLDRDIPVNSWDLAVAVSDIIEHDDPGASKIIDSVAISDWRPT